MGVITRNILTGVITILPVVLTLYLLYWLIVTTESMLGGQLNRVLPQGAYRPGLGVATGLVLAFVVGMLMNTYVVQRVFTRAEQVFRRLPLVKLVYPAIRDFVDYFSPMKKKEFEQVVSVTFGDSGMQAIGLVTQTDITRMPDGFGDHDSVLVYLPMSYMIGGYAVLMPRSALRPLDMSMDEAMRFILTAGVTGTDAESKRDRASRKKSNQSPDPGGNG
ncbi:MAG TPA: DUF502 domain-containing protein [Rhodocyclaceae bacterium]|nr:DUF502 domain-containing protein [Rhodocyclaceae bacterium]HRQ47336.1 DUF502 domain-containing protein [Rhodocyclaceae bacterium]